MAKTDKPKHNYPDPGPVPFLPGKPPKTKTRDAKARPAWQKPKKGSR